MKEIIEKLKLGNELCEKDVRTVVDSIEKNNFNKEEMKKFLLGMENKKITSNELFFFINELYKRANKIKLNCDCVDICGTGGDGRKTFNISTASIFVCAGAGVKIAKHGNKAVSSKSGSFDVLEELGINIENCSEKALQTLKETNIALFFAPAHHPIFANIGEVRKEIGQKTIFNIMGPLLNPCNVTKQLIGVYAPELTELIAETAKKLGKKRVLVVHGNGLDEITIDGETKISELNNGEIKTYTISPKDFGITQSKINDLIVQNKEESAKRIINILNGKKSSSRDIVVLNSGAAIYLSDKASTIKQGIRLAEESIDSGKALDSLKKLKEILR